MFEALADEISVEAIEFLLVVDGRSAAKSPLEGGFEQRVSVDLLKGLLNGAVGDVGCDAGRADAARHARLAATADRGLPSRDDCRRARIIDRAVGFQPFDCCVDVRRVVPAACEALTHLRFRELAPREHLQRNEIRVGCHATNLTEAPGLENKPGLHCVLRTTRL